MGDPKFAEKKWNAPSHPWRSDRIKEEGEIIKAYGLKNHREIWKLRFTLRNWRNQARTLMALKTKQSDLEEKQLLGKIASLGILGEKSSLDDVLVLQVRDILDRRLQTQVMKRGLATTAKMARQLIAHGHVALGSQKIDSPGYLVPKADEDKIGFYGKVVGVSKGSEAQ